MSPATPAGEYGNRTTGSESFRPDIEGLRAIAVGLVLAYHFGLAPFSGGYVGVDVFFVISGFLITGLLVRDLEQTGRVRLGRFYARRARRLLPASALTLAGTAVVTLAVLPATRWARVCGDVAWSSLYAVNWRLAGRAVDYLAAGDAPSPVQHYWSLAVEEQFYLIWPGLIIAAAWVARRRGGSARTWVLVAVGLVGALSLAASIGVTASVPARAFFVTQTRIWELATGASLAILAPAIKRMSPSIAAAMVWAGLGAIGLAAVQLDDRTLFPGWIAVLPVAGAAAVIAGGSGAHGSRAVGMLATRPMQSIGGLSYSLYLWHWPLLVGAEAWLGRLRFLEGLAVVGVTGLLGQLTHRFVENPIRRSQKVITPRVRGFALGAACTLVGLGAAASIGAAIPEIGPGAVPASATPTRSSSTVSSTIGPATGPDAAVPPSTEDTTRGLEDPTPAALTTEPAVTAVEDPTPTLPPPWAIVPNPLEAADDIPVVYQPDTRCHRGHPATRLPEVDCVFGPDSAEVLVSLVGDSHAAQWFPAFADLAERLGFRLEAFTKSDCPLTTATVIVGVPPLAYEECRDWNRDLMAHLIEAHPDLVVTTGAFWYDVLYQGNEIGYADAQQILGEGHAGSWQALIDAGIPVLAVQDLPPPLISGLRVPGCLVRDDASIVSCSFDRAAAMEANQALVVAAGLTDVVLVPTTDWVCGIDLCPPVIDSVLVWRDLHHMTATFAAHLAPKLEPYVATALGLAVSDASR